MTRSNLIEQLALTGEREKELSSALNGLTDKRITMYIGAFQSLQKQGIYNFNVTKIVDTLNRYTFLDATNLITAIDKNFYIPYFFYNYDSRSSNYIKNIKNFDFTQTELNILSDALTNWYTYNNITYEIMRHANSQVLCFLYEIGFLQNLTSSPSPSYNKSKFLVFYHGNIYSILWTLELFKYFSSVCIGICFLTIGLYSLILLRFAPQVSENEIAIFLDYCNQLSVCIIVCLFIVLLLKQYIQLIKSKLPDTSR